jgi:hypothetical protein
MAAMRKAMEQLQSTSEEDGIFTHIVDQFMKLFGGREEHR